MAARCRFPVSIPGACRGSNQLKRSSCDVPYSPWPCQHRAAGQRYAGWTVSRRQAVLRPSATSRRPSIKTVIEFHREAGNALGVREIRVERLRPQLHAQRRNLPQSVCLAEARRARHSIKSPVQPCAADILRSALVRSSTMRACQLWREASSGKTWQASAVAHSTSRS